MAKLRIGVLYDYWWDEDEERVEGEQKRGGRKDREAGVVDADPAVHVAQSAQRDHQHGRDEHVAHEHPQQVAHVARGERVDLDAVEDRRQ